MRISIRNHIYTHNKHMPMTVRNCSCLCIRMFAHDTCTCRCICVCLQIRWRMIPAQRQPAVGPGFGLPFRACGTACPSRYTRVVAVARARAVGLGDCPRSPGRAAAPPVVDGYPPVVVPLPPCPVSGAPGCGLASRASWKAPCTRDNRGCGLGWPPDAPIVSRRPNRFVSQVMALACGREVYGGVKLQSQRGYPQPAA